MEGKLTKWKTKLIKRLKAITETPRKDAHFVSYFVKSNEKSSENLRKRNQPPRSFVVNFPISIREKSIPGSEKLLALRVALD